MAAEPHFQQSGLVWAAQPLLRDAARQLPVGHGRCELTGTRGTDMGEKMALSVGGIGQRLSAARTPASRR